MLTVFSVPRAWGVAALALLLGVATAGRAQADDGYDDGVDPPVRVARLGYLGGEVSFAPAGDDNWVQASLNRPLVTGDALYTDRNARTELQLGGAALRLDDGTSLDVLDLDDHIAQFQLSEGVASLSVRSVGEGDSYEIDTPTLAFVATMPGEYRIDIAPDGSSTMVTVFDGDGDVYGEDGASYNVRAGNSYRFNDSALRDYEILDLPRADDFDNWVHSRQRQYSRAESSRYVADDMIGIADLDAAGSWSNDADYGDVWYPSSVAVDYVPYRDGHWSWIDPWGWTWVDNATWGFAPFHYGRWVQVRNRWGWCPGPRHVRAVYAPAMVAFVGGVAIGVGGPVGWFPLGPRDVYVPWYHASRGYFDAINVRNTRVVNNVYITNVYNDYSRGRPISGNYMWRGNAMTAVSRETFVGARPVSGGRVNVNAAQWRNAPVQSRLGIAPTQASFVAANARRASAVPQRAALDRRVIARNAPPPAAMPIAARVQAIQRNNAQPLARPVPARGAAPNAPAAQRGVPPRVQVVGGGAAKPQPLVRGNAPVGTERRPAPPARNGIAPRGNPGVVAPRGNATPPQSQVQPRGTPAPGFRNVQPSVQPRTAPPAATPRAAAPATPPRGNVRAPASETPPGFRNRAAPSTQPVTQPRPAVVQPRPAQPVPQPRQSVQPPVQRSEPQGFRNRVATPAMQPRAPQPAMQPRNVQPASPAPRAVVRPAPQQREAPARRAPPEHNRDNNDGRR